MALVRFDPAREIDSLQSDMNRLFDRFFSNSPANGNGAGAARRWIPAMDLVETEDSLVLRADLPGMTEGDVDIEVKDGTLTVSGERRSENEEKKEGYHRVERAFGRFSRALALPKGVDAERINAAFENGVLEVTIPKPEETKPTRIQIGGGKQTLEGSGTQR
jgi:HSP20 family protein